MPDAARSEGSNYLLSVAVTAAAVLLRWLLDPLLTDSFQLVTVIGAVAAAVWIGGYRPALLAALLGYFASAYLFIDPRGELGLNESRNLAGLFTYLLTCAVILVLGARAREEQRRSRDVERKLRDSQLQLQNVTDHAPVLLAHCDTDARYKFVNAHYAARFNLRPSDIVGKRIPEVVGDEAYAAFSHHVAAALSGKDVLIDVEIPYRVGGVQFMRVAYVPEWSDGKVVGFIAAISNISERKRVEDDLRRGENRLQMALSAARMIAWEYDSKSGKVAVSDNVGEIYGLLPGRKLEDSNEGFAMVHPEDVARHRQTVQKALEERGSYLSQFRLIRPIDGQVIWLEERGHAITEEDAEAGRLAGVVMDITQRKQAEVALQEAEDQFRLLADNMPQLAWIADAGTEGQVRWFNKSWLDYTGATLEDMHGTGWQTVHHPDHAERVISKFARHVREGEDWEDTFPLRGKDGRFRWFLSRMKVIRGASGAVVRIFGTNTDITDQREMADLLQQQTLQLSEADRRKDEFLATLAHELRNPLAPLRNCLQVMRQLAHPDERFEKMRLVMERQLLQLVRLVDDLLDVSRISRDMLELRKEPVELAAVVHSAVESSRPAIEAAGLELDISLPALPIYLNADMTRLAQVFLNLLNNAAKFTDRGGRVSLNAECQNGEVVVRIKDTGVGIRAENLTGIFKMFSQVDSSVGRSQGGLGIGLTLARRLLALHDGHIDARSEGLGMGSEFIVRLPLASNSSRQVTSADTAATPVARKLRILVVDDNQDAANSLAMMLEFSGHETFTAHDGLAALESAASQRPEVIVLDIGLPGLSGYEVARRIREQPWGKTMTLVALTGWGQEQDKRKAQEAGFDHHMTKPAESAELERLLEATMPPPTP